MPCGGIRPLLSRQSSHYPCWVCNLKDCDLWCEEWDTPIHSRCVPRFLKTEEGKIVLDHGHGVQMMKDGKPVVLHEERDG